MTYIHTWSSAFIRLTTSCLRPSKHPWSAYPHRLFVVFHEKTKVHIAIDKPEKPSEQAAYYSTSLRPNCASGQIHHSNNIPPPVRYFIAQKSTVQTLVLPSVGHGGIFPYARIITLNSVLSLTSESSTHCPIFPYWSVGGNTAGIRGHRLSACEHTGADTRAHAFSRHISSTFIHTQQQLPSTRFNDTSTWCCARYPCERRDWRAQGLPTHSYVEP